MSINSSENDQTSEQYNKQQHAGPRIIVALDYDNAKSATALLDRLDPQLCRVKIGKQLFTTAGPTLVKHCTERGFDVFLDLKFHDIPNTVAGACRAAADLGAWMINVHAGGGPRMLEAARTAVDSDTLLIAVTVLTSTTPEELLASGITRSMSDQVDFLATQTRDAGLDGVVCSPQEASRLKESFGAEFKLITPGVRPAGSASEDQRRVATPQDAVRAGSDYLVIGRPVTAAVDPVEALQSIHAELESTVSLVN